MPHIETEVEAMHIKHVRGDLSTVEFRDAYGSLCSLEEVNLRSGPAALEFKPINGLPVALTRGQLEALMPFLLMFVYHGKIEGGRI